jgi:hypothetical protein
MSSRGEFICLVQDEYTKKHKVVSITRIEYDFALLDVILSALSLSYFLGTLFMFALIFAICSSYCIDRMNSKYNNLAEIFAQDFDTICFKDLNEKQKIHRKKSL